MAYRNGGERSANVSGGTADMNADGKSDDFIVPSTRANKAATAVSESVEERKSPKGTVVDRHQRSGHCAGFVVRPDGGAV